MTITPSAWVWWAALALAVALFPVDAQLLPVWLGLRVRLWWINTTMRWMAWRLWRQLPEPRPPFRFIPVQHRRRP